MNNWLLWCFYAVWFSEISLIFGWVYIASHKFAKSLINGKQEVQGAFGKCVAWHHYPLCDDEMLSDNAVLETIIQRFLDGLNFVEKRLDVHVRVCSKWVGVYAQTEIISTDFAYNLGQCKNTYLMFGKSLRQIGTLFTIMIWRVNDLIPTYFLSKN